MEKKSFNPLVFLSSLGAGGIAVIPFVLLQYTMEHGEGLIARSQVWGEYLELQYSILYLFLELSMVLFSLIHFILTLYFLSKLVSWIKTPEFGELLEDPLRNSSILAPVISLLMTMNLFIGPIRYFVPAMHSSFQQMIIPAAVIWFLFFVFLMALEIRLLGLSFVKGFDIEKIHFGWLLHPFALGMLTVIGTGIAAMSRNPFIADTAAFLSMISGSMGLFLLLVKMVLLFQKHFSSDSLPEKNFLPSFLIVIPNLTLFGISMFRIAHYLEKARGVHMNSFFYLSIGIFFAFEIWYLLFGLYLLKDYFKNHHFRDFYLTQWGFICPFVAFTVLGSFAYKFVYQSPLLYGVLLAVFIFTVIFYFELLYKHIRCSGSNFRGLNCSE